MPHAAQAVLALTLALATFFSLSRIAIYGSGSLAVVIGALAILLVVVLMRYPSPALGVGWILGVVCGFGAGLGWMYHLQP